MSSTAKDSGQDSSWAHEDETCDLSEPSLTHVLYVVTLCPQLLVLFGKVIQTLEGNFAEGSMSQGTGFEILLSLRVSVPDGVQELDCGSEIRAQPFLVW